jgi:AcrR family transcriptional regulator
MNKEQCSLMQTKKEEVSKKIKIVAREEFLKKGFKNTNMRSIAKKSGVNLSNIYNYFANKDQIFESILKPAIGGLDRLIEEHNQNEHVDVNIFQSKAFRMKEATKIVEYIYKFRDELNILLFHSHGSSLENFREKYIEINNKKSLEYFRLMKKKYPKISTDISQFFIHTMSSCWMTIISEIVMHKMEKKKIKKFYEEFIEYSAAGWKKLMNV